MKADVPKAAKDLQPVGQGRRIVEKLMSPLEDILTFGGPEAVDRHHRWTHGGQEKQFPPSVLVAGERYGFEKIKSSLEMCDCFLVGGATCGKFAGFQPKAQGLGGHSRFR